MRASDPLHTPVSVGGASSSKGAGGPRSGAWPGPGGGWGLDPGPQPPLLVIPVIPLPQMSVPDSPTALRSANLVMPLPQTHVSLPESVPAHSRPAHPPAPGPRGCPCRPPRLPRLRPPTRPRPRGWRSLSRSRGSRGHGRGQGSPCSARRRRCPGRPRGASTPGHGLGGAWGWSLGEGAGLMESRGHAHPGSPGHARFPPARK